MKNIPFWGQLAIVLVVCVLVVFFGYKFWLAEDFNRIGELQKQLDEKNVKVKLTPEARGWLAEHGYDPLFGARPMARLVDQAIKRPLAEAILFGDLKDGGEALFEVKDDKLVLKSMQPALTPA